MFLMLQVITILLVAITLTTALAHVLELPGKLRLGEEQYLSVQTIYYPGFTIAGVAEPLGILAALLLTIFMPAGTAQFYATLGGLVSLVVAHALYWVITHRVNNFWLKDAALKGAGKSFFAFGAGSGDPVPDWTVLRDRWEYSHVARAAFALLGLTLLTIAVAL
jgi:hypothetical protein